MERPERICNPKGRNQKIKINLENFKFGRNRGEIRSDDLPIKEPGFLPTFLQHFGAGLVYFELHRVMQGIAKTAKVKLLKTKMGENEKRAWRRGGASWTVACPVQWRRRRHSCCVCTDLVHDHRPSFACVLVCCRRGTRPSIHGGCSLMVEKCMRRAYILIWRDQDGCVAHNRCIIDSFECMQHP